jgi:transcription elongation factor Elf1
MKTTTTANRMAPPQTLETRQESAPETPSERLPRCTACGADKLKLVRRDDASAQAWCRACGRRVWVRMPKK